MGEVIKIASVSGKGGVGKTTLTIGLARALQAQGYRVGLIDLDLDSSSLGDVAGLTHDKLLFHDKIEPVDFGGLPAMSLSVFNSEGWEDTPTLLSEENVFKVVRQLFVSVNWPVLDFLVIDHPPGTGAALRALVRQGIDGLLLVTASQRVSEMPVRRLIRMARDEFPVEILGIVDNDPYNAAAETSSAKALSDRYGLPVLGIVPWDQRITKAMDARTELPLERFEGIATAVIEHYRNRLGGNHVEAGTGQRVGAPKDAAVGAAQAPEAVAVAVAAAADPPDHAGGTKAARRNSRKSPAPGGPRRVPRARGKRSVRGNGVAG